MTFQTRTIQTVMRALALAGFVAGAVLPAVACNNKPATTEPTATTPAETPPAAATPAAGSPAALPGTTLTSPTGAAGGM